MKFIIEPNKIYNCDCIEGMKNILDENIDMIITDPPYGIDYKSNKQITNTRNNGKSPKRNNYYFNKIYNDNNLFTKWLEEAYRILKDNSSIYIYCHWSKWGELQIAVNNAGFKIKNMIVINKSNHGMGDLKGSYAPKHELLMYAVKGRHLLNNIPKRQKDVIDLPVKFSGAKRLHSNEKPESWYKLFIIQSSNEGDLILDPFIGSGTAAIVCKKLNRDYIGFEISKKDCEITKQRIIEYKKNNPDP